MSPRADRLLTLAMLVLLPLLCLASANGFHRSLLVFGVINAIAAVGLCLMLGFAGQASLGQAAIFGIGAYATTVLANRFAIEPVLCIAVGAVVAMAVGWAISRPLSRLHDHYLAMATLAFGTLAWIAFANLGSITGGLDPGISVGKLTLLGLDLSSMIGLFFVAWVALIGAVFVAGNVAASKIGRSLRAIRMSPVAAASVGIDVVRAKALVFAIASLMTGLAGGLYAYYARSFNASAFGVGLSIDLLMMVVIGSLHRISGAIAGAFIITALPVLFESLDDYKTMVFGISMVLIMKFMPAGLVDGVLSSSARLLRRGRA